MSEINEIAKQIIEPVYFQTSIWDDTLYKVRALGFPENNDHLFTVHGLLIA